MTLQLFKKLSILAFLFMLAPSLAFSSTTVQFEITINSQAHSETGKIEIQLMDNEAPITVANFLDYVQSGYYNGTIFHRVINNFMIQGGGFHPGMKRKDTMAPIVNEAHNGLKNNIGTIAMARTSQVNSATSQFFINVANNASLNHRNKSASGYGYCVFGRVTKGMELVNKIKAVRTTKIGGYANVPLYDVVIKEALVVTRDAFID